MENHSCLQLLQVNEQLRQIQQEKRDLELNGRQLVAQLRQDLAFAESSVTSLQEELARVVQASEQSAEKLQEAFSVSEEQRRLMEERAKGLQFALEQQASAENIPSGALQHISGLEAQLGDLEERCQVEKEHRHHWEEQAKALQVELQQTLQKVQALEEDGLEMAALKETLAQLEMQYTEARRLIEDKAHQGEDTQRNMKSELDSVLRTLEQANFEMAGLREAATDSEKRLEEAMSLLMEKEDIFVAQKSHLEGTISSLKLKVHDLVDEAHDLKTTIAQKDKHIEGVEGQLTETLQGFYSFYFYFYWATQRHLPTLLFVCCCALSR